MKLLLTARLQTAFMQIFACKPLSQGKTAKPPKMEAALLKLKLVANVIWFDKYSLIGKRPPVVYAHSNFGHMRACAVSWGKD